MNCCDYNCHQGKDCPARQAECRHCKGIGFDAGGQRCDCAPLTGTWRDYLGDLVRALFYVLAIMVIAGPTLIMILTEAK
jgi:hypothetical protein